MSFSYRTWLTYLHIGGYISGFEYLCGIIILQRRPFEKG
ncbi:hypothetical protein BACCAP_04246 [Pseudoflavonifractor capillosus ATCC 29799]|uniref:Uncharacterized protein n=1 Tax=Pseudoflavonifractor capillosus ATCC 29799 TaxID=411467 RepID=A6P178_9FIRM|nr:hypothetical protein BACCAP_04246 [Pseudoflavonifractor capillosus ATCC 29799]